MLINGNTIEEINEKYPQTTRGNIERINTGKAWHKDTLNYPLTYMKGISPEEVKKIIVDLEEDILSLKEIGEKYGYCRSAIVNINQGKT